MSDEKFQIFEMEDTTTTTQITDISNSNYDSNKHQNIYHQHNHHDHHIDPKSLEYAILFSPTPPILPSPKSKTLNNKANNNKINTENHPIKFITINTINTINTNDQVDQSEIMIFDMDS